MKNICIMYSIYEDKFLLHFLDKSKLRKKQTDIVHFVTFAIVGFTKENPIITHI